MARTPDAAEYRGKPTATLEEPWGKKTPEQIIADLDKTEGLFLFPVKVAKGAKGVVNAGGVTRDIPSQSLGMSMLVSASGMEDRGKDLRDQRVVLKHVLAQSDSTWVMDEPFEVALTTLALNGQGNNEGSFVVPAGKHELKMTVKESPHDYLVSPSIQKAPGRKSSR
jgi:hypothetical protein